MHRFVHWEPPLVDSSTHGCTAQHADVQLRRPGPLVHRHAMPSSSRQVHSPLRPFFALEWQPQNSTCTHRVFLRAPPQGISDLHIQKQYTSEGALLCITFASQLDALWCMVPSVFCFPVAVHVRLHAMGNKLENALPPLPILRPHPRACLPPFDNSMLCVTLSLYLCPFGAYLFFVVHVSLDTKGNECIA